jgi:fluoride exporter
MTVILIVMGGFIGAICRFAVGCYFKRSSPTSLPFSTLMINLSGSFLLGLIIGWNIQGPMYSLLGVGFMGSFTTFSTFKLEAFQLGENRKGLLFYTYIATTYVGGIFLAYLGISLSR